MELIQIIYDTLILGTFLLSIVVLVSFVKYKTRKNEREGRNRSSVRSRILEMSRTVIAPTPVVKPDAQVNRIPASDILLSSVPIYRLDQYKTREIKIVRRPTSIPFTDERYSQNYSRFTRTNGGAKSGRYVILNEEINSEQNIRVVNFNS